MTVTNRKNKIWIMVFVVMIAIMMLGLVARLFYLQIAKGEYYYKKAYEQQTKDRKIEADRGTIYDATGKKKLAQSVTVNTVSIVSSDIKKENKEMVATKLAEFLGLEKEEVLKKVNKKSSREIIAKKVEQEKAKEILAWVNKEEIKGVYIDEDVKRLYPYNSLASHVIGFTGTDNQGLYGVESKYNEVLSGVPGKIVGIYDVAGRETPFKEEKYIDPKNGMDIVLTIDATIQQIVEKELKKAAIENRAKSATAIVMNPKTGEVIAMANYPDYDLNNPFEPITEDLKVKFETADSKERKKILEDMWINDAISSAYEPGSSFKIITTAAALEENLVGIDDKAKFNCTGVMKIGGWDIRCWRHPRNHGLQSLREGLQNSCNPVFMQISQMISSEVYCEYLDAFKFGKKTGIDLPGEETGVVHDPKTITAVDMATTAFGQTFSTTCLQLTAAISAVANNGVYMTPHIVKEIKSQDGKYSKKIEPVAEKQIVSEKTSKDVLSAMESTAEVGTAKAVKIQGYRVGGKTATAEQERGSNLWYAGGFVGVAPINDPEFVVTVYLYDPQGDQGHSGGLLAGPVVANILEETLRYYDIKPDYKVQDTNMDEIIVPDITGKTVKEARDILNQVTCRLELNSKASDTDVIKDQLPKAGASINKNSLVRGFTVDGDVKQTVTVPNLKGLSMTKCIETLNNLGLNIRIVGTGNAISQDPQQGTQIEKGSIVTVKFVEGNEWH